LFPSSDDLLDLAGDACRVFVRGNHGLLFAFLSDGVRLCRRSSTRSFWGEPARKMCQYVASL
jgi:hypothetical protein